MAYDALNWRLRHDIDTGDVRIAFPGGIEWIAWILYGTSQQRLQVSIPKLWPSTP
jgi:hypothetical protein